MNTGSKDIITQEAEGEIDDMHMEFNSYCGPQWFVEGMWIPDVPDAVWDKFEEWGIEWKNHQK